MFFRTHSLILVDTEQNVEFVEQTMRMPVDMDNPQWDTTTIAFKLDSPPS